jgi:3-hydroxyisobutyrate dehydrogenase-like beta-hydroxyacid dehydrogenase
MVMAEITVGLLHPGEMGAAVGQCLTMTGHRVLWWPGGRSPASAKRAAAAGLTPVDEAGADEAGADEAGADEAGADEAGADPAAGGAGAGLSRLAAEADVIISIVPPHGAVELAQRVAGAGFGGVYTDANAISPATAREVARIVSAGGAAYVDGGIIGTPPVAPGFIRLYLSGARAAEVQQLFAGSPADVRVLGPDPAAASALKMAYASWTKGSSALLLAARALARADGVEEALLAEWQLSQAALAQRSDRAAAAAAATRPRMRSWARCCRRRDCGRWPHPARLTRTVIQRAG